MPRLTEEERTKHKEEVRKLRSERAKALGKQISERKEKELKQIINSKQPISFTELLKEFSCRSDRTLKIYLKRMLERQEIAKEDGKRGKYVSGK